MSEPGDLAYKILSTKTPLELWIEMLAVPHQMQEAMVFWNNVKTLSVLFQRPQVEPLIAFEQAACQSQPVFIFRWGWANVHVIPQLHQLFQTGSCNQHVGFTVLHGVCKSWLDDRDESRQEVPRLCPFAIQDRVLLPWLGRICEHRQSEIGQPVLAFLLAIMDLDLGEENSQPIQRFFGCSLPWPLIVAAVMQNSSN